MKKRNQSSQTSQTSRHWISVKGFPRLYKRVGVRVTSFIYKYPDGRSETLATVDTKDRRALGEAELRAKRLTMDIQSGTVVAGTVRELIERFLDEIAPTRYADQSKNGIYYRRNNADKLIAVFGDMNPKSLKTIHGYQYLEARAKQGAPQAANKEMSLFRVICTQAVKWGLIDVNPFLNMEANVSDVVTRAVTRSQVTRFYLYCMKQDFQPARTIGAAAMFSFLTGFRATEVRNFLKSGITNDGVIVINAKRKRGERELKKLRHWTLKLRCVVARALEHETSNPYLFAPTKGMSAYTRSGWGTVWQRVWAKYLGVEIAELLAHPKYFTLQDVRPASITEKLEMRDADAYDFAAHSNPATTKRHYDRRSINRADALE
mgnify:FL=1